MTENGHDPHPEFDPPLDPTVETWELVARLTPAEHVEVQRATAEFERVAMQWKLMQAGINQLWGMLRRKYALSADVVYDPDDGVFVRRRSSPPDAPAVIAAAPEAAVSPAPPPHPPRRRGKRGRR